MNTERFTLGPLRRRVVRAAHEAYCQRIYSAQEGVLINGERIKLTPAEEYVAIVLDGRYRSPLRSLYRRVIRLVAQTRRSYRQGLANLAPSIPSDYNNLHARTSEVETIRLGLSKKLISLKLTNIIILAPNSFDADTKPLIGSKVTNIWRRAKMLGIDIQKAAKMWTLLIHLKMSGQLILIQKTKNQRLVGGHPTGDMLGQMPNKSTRVILEFNDQSKLYFNDQRRFGWIKSIPRIQSIHRQDGDLDLLSRLGPEPLDASFTWQQLHDNLMKRKNQPIKVALLDQQIIAGIGNIYACESCFLAKLDPRRKVHSLNNQDFQNLHHAIQESLKAGIKHGGSTKTHFVNAEGKKGLFLAHAYVYSRENQPCKICGTQLQKIRLAGRGTIYCPKCQT